MCRSCLRLLMNSFDVLMQVSSLTESCFTTFDGTYEWLLVRVDAQMSKQFAYTFKFLATCDPIFWEQFWRYITKFLAFDEIQQCLIFLIDILIQIILVVFITCVVSIKIQVTSTLIEFAHSHSSFFLEHENNKVVASRNMFFRNV